MFSGAEAGSRTVWEKSEAGREARPSQSGAAAGCLEGVVGAWRLPFREGQWGMGIVAIGEGHHHRVNVGATPGEWQGQVPGAEYKVQTRQRGWGQGSLQLVSRWQGVQMGGI